MIALQAKAGVSGVIEKIEKALATLPPDADSPWMNLDKMPYIHKTDDPKASPWNCAVVGRFDYLQTMEYMLACQPANIRQLLAALAAERAEAVRMRERYEALLTKIDDAWANYERMGEICPFEGQPMIYAATLEEIHEARAALRPSQQGSMN